MMRMSEMELVEHYLAVMAEHLPVKIREDVINEMRGNIMDMLPDAPTDKDIRTVLEKLGDPVILAGSYIRDKKYLIGPAVYDNYISVLKLAVGIVAIVSAFLSMLSFLFGQPEGTADISIKGAIVYSGDLIAEIIASAFQGALIACVWVTVIFVVFERSGVSRNSLSCKKQWTVDDLPLQSSDDKGRISRAETITGLFFSVFFTILLLTRPQLIGWYEMVNDALIIKEPLINIEQLSRYTFAIIALTAMQFALSIYKFAAKRWYLPMAIFNTVYNIAVGIFIYVISVDPNFFNSGIISLFAQKVGWSYTKLQAAFQHLMTGFTVFIIIMCAVDSIFGFVKSRRLKLPSFIINIK
jgi:hypothetical protein